jgi:chlorobactene glucosyltransferase
VWPTEVAVIHALLLAAVLVDGMVLLFLAVNLLTIRRLSRGEPVRDAGPMVSIVIPARNEERRIEPAVRSHLAQNYSDFEVIVVDDESTDSTGAILTALAGEDPRLRVVTGREPPPGWLGKPHALWLGAREARGRILLFADADVIYHPDALALSVGFLEASEADLLCLLPRIETVGFWESVLMPYLLNAFFLAPGFLTNCDRVRGMAAGGGAGNLVRRGAYDRAGGHAAIRESVIDDIHLALRVKKAGLRTRTVRAEDHVSVRMYQGFREICDGFTKNVAYAFSGPFGLAFAVHNVVGIVLTISPVAVLLGALMGWPVPAPDLWLAAAAYGAFVIPQAALALSLRYPIWPSATHPIMAAVWAGIICRSFYQRIVRRRLTWRGREFDARGARF